MAREAEREGKTVRQVALERGLLTEEEFDQAISPAAILRLATPNGGANR